MKKKEVLVLASLILLLSIVVVSADVAYLYKKQFNIDQNIVKVLEDHGFNVDLINDRDIPRTNFNGYDFIVVGDDKFLNDNRIPVNDIPSIILNYHHAETWGLTDEEGVSLLASNNPLRVNIAGRLIQVYTRATELRRSINLKYYFLDAENIVDSMETIAFVEVTSSGSDFGSVIAYARPGDRMKNGKIQQAKMCFYGIVDSDFWTDAARDMFMDCFNFIASECLEDSDCPTLRESDPFCQEDNVMQINTEYSCRNGDNLLLQCASDEDLILIEECDFGCNDGRCIEGIHNIELEDIGFLDRNGRDVDELICEEEYKVFAKVRNNGDFQEEVLFEALIDDFPIEINRILNLDFGSLITTRSIFIDLSEGKHFLSVLSFIDEDEDEGDNFLIEEFSLICPAISCFEDNDCGIDGFVNDAFCSENNVVGIFEEHKCKNPGRRDSFCTSSENEEIIEQCSGVCSINICLIVECENDRDCDDRNPLTFDECINAGTIASECRNTILNCASDSDCGSDGFIGEEFCSEDRVSKNFQSFNCMNPGSRDSHCESSIISNELNRCEYACFDGSCVRCDENSDCNDGSDLTLDICHNAGTVESFCSNDRIREKDIKCDRDLDCGVNELLSRLCSRIHANIYCQIITIITFRILKTLNIYTFTSNTKIHTHFNFILSNFR